MKWFIKWLIIFVLIVYWLGYFYEKIKKRENCKIRVCSEFKWEKFNNCFSNENIIETDKYKKCLNDENVIID